MFTKEFKKLTMITLLALSAFLLGGVIDNAAAAVVTGPIVGTWGASTLGYYNVNHVWYTESSRIVFNDDGTGSVTGTKNDGENQAGQRIKPISEAFTYTFTPNTDGSYALTLFIGSETHYGRIILSDNGSMAIMDGTAKPDWEKFTTLVRIDATKTYGNADVSGEYYSLGYESNVDHVVDPPNGNGSFMAISSIHNFAGAAGTYTYAGKANSVYLDGHNGIWDDNNAGTRNYAVNANGMMTVGAGAFQGYVAGDGKIFSGSGSYLSNNWMGYFFMKKGDKTYAQSDLAGKWAVVSFGQDSKAGEPQIFYSGIGTMTCDATGQCTFKVRDRVSGESATSAHTKNLTVTVASDGSFGGSLAGGSSPSYAGAIGNDGNTMIFNISFNPDEIWHRKIFVAVRASNVGDLAGAASSVDITNLSWQDRAGRQISYDFSSGTFLSGPPYIGDIILLPPEAVINSGPDTGGQYLLARPYDEWPDVNLQLNAGAGTATLQTTGQGDFLQGAVGFGYTGTVGSTNNTWTYSVSLTNFIHDDTLPDMYDQSLILIGNSDPSASYSNPLVGAQWYTGWGDNVGYAANVLYLFADLFKMPRSMTWTLSKFDQSNTIKLTGLDPSTTTVDLKAEIQSGTDFIGSYSLDRGISWHEIARFSSAAGDIPSFGQPNYAPVLMLQRQENNDPFYVRSAHYQNLYLVIAYVKDLTHQYGAVTLSGPRLAVAVSMVYNSATKRWELPAPQAFLPSDIGPIIFSLGSTAPTAPATYTFTTDQGTYERTINEFVEDFATGLSMTYNMLGIPVFSWTPVQNQNASYQCLVVRDANVNRIWFSEPFSASRASITYNGPPLVQGQTYYYEIESFIGSDSPTAHQINLSNSLSQFTYYGHSAVGNPFPIATTSGQEEGISAAFDGTNYLVGIQGDDIDHANITAQLVSQSGALVGSRISVGRTGGAPSVSFDGTNYLLVWPDDATNDQGYDVLMGQLVSKSGLLVGSPFSIGPQSYHDGGPIIFDGTNYFVVWESRKLEDPGDSADVYGQFITPSGTLLGSAIPVSTAIHGQRMPKLAYDGTRILVAWADGRNQSACYTDGQGTHCSESDIYGQFVTKSSAGAAGTLSGSNFLINASSLPRDNPLSIAFDGTNYFIAFSEETTLPNACPISGCTWHIFGQLVTPAGALSGGTIRISTAPGEQIGPVIAFDGTNYLVSWTDMRNDTNGNWSCDAGEGTCWDIYGQFLSRSGTLIGSEFIINNDAGNQLGGFVGQAVNGKLFGLINTGVNKESEGGISGGDVYGVFMDVTVGAKILNPPDAFDKNKDYAIYVGGFDTTAYKYKLDNDPSWSSEYLIETPITFTLSNEGPHTLYVIGKDSQGKWQTEENATTVNWTVDFTNPTVNITSPNDGAVVNQINTIVATASDATSGISSMEFQVTDGFWFVSVNEISGLATLVPTETWIKANVLSGNSWYIPSNNFPWEYGKNYTITARAVDKAGNVARDSVYVTYHDVNNNPAWTTLFLDLSSQTILNGGKIEVSGKLTRLPAGDPLVSLAGLSITLTITDPDQIASQQTVSTYDSAGHFELIGASAISGFTQKGVYTIQASFAGNSGLYKAESVKKAVLVGSQAGYAVIVEGKIPIEEGLASHNKTANRIYDKLIDRGFLPDNIYYFNYNTSQNGVDDAPTKAKVQNIIENWIYPKMNGSPAPLFIIFVDHGNRNAFRLNNETISPTDLNNWLKTMEGNLSTNAKKEKRIIIFGACYSGTFIPELSIDGRIVISSSAGDEESYKGPQEPDGIRSGEFFLEELFDQLWRGQSLKDSFEYAAKQIKLYTHKGGNNANSSNPYSDQSMQHPLLDDNGDKRGSNSLSEGYGDGQTSAGIYLGTGLTYNTNSAENPADLLSVTPTLYLNSSTSSATLWATANDDSQVGSAWYEVRSPSMVLSSQGGSGQLEIDLDKQMMTKVNGRWEQPYSSFSESGKYEVYYFVKDAFTNEISPMKRSVVYKAKDGNHPPRSFSLLAPLNVGDQYYRDPKTVLIFNWEAALDPDPGDAVTYNLIIASDSQFTNKVIRKEELTSSFTYLDYSSELKDLTTYYWKVEAVDSYGAKTSSSSVWSFKTNNTNELAGFITGRVYSGSNYNPISGAQLEASLGGAHAASFADGTYIMLVPAGTASVYGTKAGFDDIAITGIHVNEGTVTKVDVMMQPEGSLPDTTAPISHASPAGGTYHSAVELILTCDDGNGSGCSAIHYTLDSSEPTSDSPTYSAPIRLIKTTTLKFYAKDNAGNAESVHTQTYTINAVKGDLNFDGNVNLEDAIAALQVLTGIGNDDMNKDAEINNDGRIGLEEVVYILQKVSGLR